MIFPSLANARLGTDVAAGLTLAAVAIPEQLATARLAGLVPASGLVAFAAASVAFAVLGRSRTLSVGADSTIAPVIAEASAAILAVMVGLILVTVRILRLGWLADLLSAPVGAGLMAGIAVHIAVGRLPSLLNLDLPVLSTGQTLASVARNIGAANPWSLALGLGVAVACAFGHRLAPRSPMALIAIVVAALVALTVDPEGTRLPRIGALAGGLSWFPVGELHVETVLGLMPAALTIAFLCVTQTLVIEQASGDRDTMSMPRS